ncbi:MAG: SUMF1/EgtB/PvdO family nonheme iron enzyme [Chloroflexi bacterium]|nr:SUMF1/EgtB/PvdO family nonheme iron enzyme [Chloroflexota bacterium]
MTTQKPTLFISYRRADHPDFVERIRDWFIANGYEDEHVFMDLSNMPYFTDFAEFIREKVLESEVVIVIIGPQWLELLRERAIRDETDYVRLEIAIALEQGRLVAPICIKGAKMPSAKDLQDFPDLKQMTRYHAPELDSGRPFLKNVADIIGALEAELERRNDKKVMPPPPVKSKPKLTPEQQKLLDLIADANAEPPQRAEAGRRLAEIGDPRPGVGLRTDGIPDIDWVEIPAGEFIFGGDDKAYQGFPRQKLNLDTFSIARCPVTFVQFQAFVDAKDGIQNDRWWVGLAEEQKATFEQTWPIANHPRENVSWYQAMAFCGWLSAKVGYEVTLPTEPQWEKAARGTVGLFYPWRNEYISGYANLDETDGEIGPYYLRQTTAVGIYPKGASLYGVLDMAGNVWEWTLSDFDNTSNSDIKGNPRRVVKGGSWRDNLHLARLASRNGGLPSFWDFYLGFRVVCILPS